MNNHAKAHQNITDPMDKNEVKDSNIAYYMNMASMSPPVELHAATIRNLLTRNNKITVYLLGRSFKSPSENPFNRKSIYNFSNFRARDAIANLPVNVKVIDLSKHSPNVPEAKLEALELGVMSSLASATKAQDKGQLNAKWTKVYDRMLHSAKKMYNYFLAEIEQEKYDFVFMFNGRFGCVKPALEATRDSNIGFGLCETKKTINEIVFINELIHSIEGNTWRAKAFYAKNPEQGDKSAAEFFNKKVKHEATGDPVFTSVQSKGLLPEVYENTDKKLVVVYPTTEDEYKFIGKEWDGHVPESQVDEIDELAASLNPAEYLIVVKMHPNQATTAENTQARYQELTNKHPHVLVEPPLSKVDTYALMFRADVCISFASTIGVEATYAGKVSLLIGDTNWSHIDAAHQTHYGKEAAALIKTNPEPKPKKNATIWGYYLADYKDKLPSYKRVGNGDYYVDNRRIGKSSKHRILQLPAKLEIEISKPGFTFSKIFIKRAQGVAKNIIKGRWAIN